MVWNPVDETGEEAVRIEIFNLLAVLYSIDKKQECVLLHTFTRHEFLSETVALEVIFRELVLGLCRLADLDSNTWSLQGVWKTRQAELERINAKRIKAALQEYGRAVEPWKTELRHKRIAHYSKNEPEVSGKISDIRKVVKMAVNSFDLIMGMRQEYTMSVGSQEKTINLRESIEI